MALIEIEDLPAMTADVLRRRARAAGLPPREYVRRELIEMAGRRVPLDAVVEFLAQERPKGLEPEIDHGAMALIDLYDLPTEVCGVFMDRAAAAQQPLSDYVRQELIASARRRSVEDAMLEIREVAEQNPDLAIDMEAFEASVRYARGM
ncbi:hypothetical protein [Nocardia inohanensis]|uniref:hypothetical protein n=1 Tax=Nocardia inohanensis TaxID=209246 RepID=UPI000831878A|nr:hypothetical protein [Nocardia inohanensis]